MCAFAWDIRRVSPVRPCRKSVPNGHGRVKDRIPCRKTTQIGHRRI